MPPPTLNSEEPQNPHCSPVDEQECEESGLRCPTMWIGCDDLDRLITYPEASFLSRSVVPTQKRRSYPEHASPSV